MRLILCAVMAMGLLEAGCSTSSKTKDEVSIHKLFAETIRVRRPSGPGAAPDVGEGGNDFRSNPVPDARFDCKKPGEVLGARLNLPEVRGCLRSLPPGTHLKYKLDRSDEPELVFESEAEDGGPACVARTFARIPVPREIFFQTLDLENEGTLECYSSRLDIEKDEWLGAKGPSSWETSLLFPLSDPKILESDEEFIREATAWMLTPFFDPDTHAMRSRLVADKYCRQCIGEKEMLTPKSPPTPYWP